MDKFIGWVCFGIGAFAVYAGLHAMYVLSCIDMSAVLR